MTRVTISGVRNPTHVIHVASWLRQLLRRSEATISVVDRDHSGFLDALDPTGAALMPESDRLDLTGAPSSSGDSDRYYVAVGSPGLKSWFSLAADPRAWPIRTIVVDEGFGSYGGWTSRRAAMRREGAGQLETLFRASSVSSSRALLGRRRWSLYRRSRGGWRLNEAIADEFRRHVQVAERSPEVVLMSQPWVELGVVGADEYDRRVAELATVVRASGYDFSVRPHQREHAARHSAYECIRTDAPAELEPRIVGARLVVGESSTALLNLSAVFGTPVARIDGLLPETARLARTRRQQSLLDAFIPSPVTAHGLVALLDAEPPGAESGSLRFGGDEW